MPLSMASVKKCNKLLCFPGVGDENGAGNPLADGYPSLLTGEAAKITFASICSVLGILSAVSAVYLLCGVVRTRHHCVSPLVVNSVLAVLILTLLSTPLFYLENLSDINIGSELCGVQRFSICCSGIAAGLSVSIDLFARLCNSGKDIRGKALYFLLPCIWMLSVACAVPSTFSRTLKVTLTINETRHVCVSDLHAFGEKFERFYNVGFVGLAFLLPAAVMVLVMTVCLGRKLCSHHSVALGSSSITYGSVYLAGWTPYGSIWFYYWVTPTSTELDQHAIFFTRLLTFCFLLLTNLWPLHFACYRRHRSGKHKMGNAPTSSDNTGGSSSSNNNDDDNTAKLVPLSTKPVILTNQKDINLRPPAASLRNKPIYSVQLSVEHTSDHPSSPTPLVKRSSTELPLRTSPPAIPFTTVVLPLARPSRTSRSLKDRFKMKFRGGSSGTAPITRGRNGHSGSTIATNDLEYRPIAGGSFSGRGMNNRGGENSGNGVVPIDSGSGAFHKPMHTVTDKFGVVAEFFELENDRKRPPVRERRRRGGSERTRRSTSSNYFDPDHCPDLTSPNLPMDGNDNVQTKGSANKSQAMSTDPFGVINPSFDVTASGDDTTMELPPLSRSPLASLELPPPPPVPLKSIQPFMHFYSHTSLDDSGFETGNRGRSRSSQLALRYNLGPEIYSSTHTDI